MTEPSFVLYDAGRRSGLPNGRYEYRVWPRQVHPAVSYLQRRWALVSAERRSDIYLLSTPRNSNLVKLRNSQQLEIKRRHQDVGTIQYWTMPVSAEFPLATTHQDQVAQALTLRRGLTTKAGQSPAHFLASLPAQTPTVDSHRVQKSRLVFERGACRAEVCRVGFGRWSGLSIALESPSLPSIATAMDDLQLGTLPNRSYGEMIELLCGAFPARCRLQLQFQPDERR